MLIGEIGGKLAEKNRIALPKQFRNELKGKLFLTRGYESCLMILDEERWKNLIKNIEIKPFLNRSVRDTKRFVIGGAQEMNLDRQGRFMITESLQNYADIGKEIVFVGIMDWLEVWSKEIWDLKIEDLKQNAGEIADRLAA